MVKAPFLRYEEREGGPRVERASLKEMCDGNLYKVYITSEYNKINISFKMNFVKHFNKIISIMI